MTLYWSAAVELSLNISAEIRARSSTGKDSGDGLPAASEIIEGSVSALKISRIAEGFSACIFSEMRYSIKQLPFHYVDVPSENGTEFIQYFNRVI